MKNKKPPKETCAENVENTVNTDGALKEELQQNSSGNSQILHERNDQNMSGLEEQSQLIFGENKEEHLNDSLLLNGTFVIEDTEVAVDQNNTYIVAETESHKGNRKSSQNLENNDLGGSSVKKGGWRKIQKSAQEQGLGKDASSNLLGPTGSNEGNLSVQDIKKKHTERKGKKSLNSSTTGIPVRRKATEEYCGEACVWNIQRVRGF